MDREGIIDLMNSGKYVEAYALAFPDWGPQLAIIPYNLQGGLARYILQGVMPGHFLTAVLSNDLFGAFGRADTSSAANMQYILGFLYNYAPSECYRSPEKVAAWAEKGGYLGHESEGESE